MTEPTVPTPTTARPPRDAEQADAAELLAMFESDDASIEEGVAPLSPLIDSRASVVRTAVPLQPVDLPQESAADEVVIIHELLAAHRSMVIGALQANPRIDIEGAFLVHARLCRVLAHWDDFSAREQREVVEVVHYVVDADDDQPDLSGSDGFSDDLQRVRQLIEFLEVTW